MKNSQQPVEATPPPPKTPEANGNGGASMFASGFADNRPK